MVETFSEKDAKEILELDEWNNSVGVGMRRGRRQRDFVGGWVNVNQQREEGAFPECSRELVWGNSQNISLQ
jgi:hypothetical protein